MLQKHFAAISFLLQMHTVILWGILVRPLCVYFSQWTK